MLLDIVAKTQQKDKFEVTPQNVAYLAALVSGITQFDNLNKQINIIQWKTK